MARRKPRTLVVGEHRFLCTVSHLCGDCREQVRFRRMGSTGDLRVVFRSMPGDGYLVADGILHVGQVRHADGRFLNLHEPGVLYPLLAEVVARGWQASSSARAEMDGWDLFDAVATRRASPRPDSGGAA